MEAGMRGQPSLYFGMFVGGVIVGDEMDVEIGRRLAIDGFEKAEPLLVTVPLGDAGDQLAIEVVHRCEQGERPMADVVVGFCLNMADAQG